ncbi:MAG: FAD binding domain-containing protein [Gammaproteobacteria bacterium]|nr:FAD binding domain-containing protein [Gammaproteobacteria bacterium]MBI5616204.1 FAD binding domain-containing protein [Gammaproteobacteria bacterium]
MYPAKIDDYSRPATIAEAVAALASFGVGEAMCIAGGMSLMQAIKSRLVRPACLVDLQDVAELRGIRGSGGALSIGAMTRYVEIAGHAPFASGPFAALRDAASHVGDRQVRNRGTIGGSLCWNYMAACLPAAVLALGATLRLVGPGGERTIAIDDFLIGPLETARGEQEVLVSIDWKSAPARSGSAYKKWGLVKDALPVVGVAALVTLEANGACSAARLALAGLTAGAQRVPAGEAALLGSKGDAASLDRALEAVCANVDLHSDHWADAAYRGQLVRQLGRDVLTSAFARAKN